MCSSRPRQPTAQHRSHPRRAERARRQRRPDQPPPTRLSRSCSRTWSCGPRPHRRSQIQPAARNPPHERPSRAAAATARGQLGVHMSPTATSAMRGKTVLITGASSGIGLQTARALATAGADPDPALPRPGPRGRRPRRHRPTRQRRQPSRSRRRRPVLPGRHPPGRRRHPQPLLPPRRRHQQRGRRVQQA
jgi:hypothetical protein